MLCFLSYGPSHLAQAQGSARALSDLLVHGRVVRATYEICAGSTVLFLAGGNPADRSVYSAYRVSAAGGTATRIGSMARSPIYKIGTAPEDMPYAPEHLSMVFDDQRMFLAGVPLGLDVTSLDN